MNINIMSKLYQHQEISISIDFNLDHSIYLNATKTAKQFKTAKGNSKDINEWLSSKTTQEYISVVKNLITESIWNNELVVIKQGGKPQEQGTWIHISLADEFFRWLLPTETYIKFKFSGMINEVETNNRLLKSIYIVQVSNGAIKIGISSDTKRRFFEIENSCGFDIVKQLTTEHTSKAYEIEQFLLAYFDDYRINGEWLKNITFEKVVEKLKSVFAKHHPETIKLSFLEKLK